MNIQRTLKYLERVAKNNNRDWCQAHKDEYLTCRDDLEEGVDCAIAAVSKFGASVSHIVAKEARFRFNRDTCLSSDKSLYKRRFGTYISAKGRKSLHAGYYIHVQPGHCLLSAGSYWLPAHILTPRCSEIVGNIDEWRKCVGNGKFVYFSGYAAQGLWSGEQASDKGFGISRLKTCPKGLPIGYEFIDYLRMKDCACWHRVEDDSFVGNGWIEPMTELLKVAQPMMEFTSHVIDGYE